MNIFRSVDTPSIEKSRNRNTWLEHEGNRAQIDYRSHVVYVQLNIAVELRVEANAGDNNLGLSLSSPGTIGHKPCGNRI